MISNPNNCPVVMTYNLRELQIDCFRWAMQNNLEVSKASATEFVCFDSEVRLALTYAFIDSQLVQGHRLEDILQNESNWIGE